MTSGEGGTGGSPKAHYGRIEDPRLSAEEMDERRQQNMAYEYLCHLEEAKVWIEACINEALPATTELEEGLRNGVYLGKLAHFMAPELVPLKKIYDRDQSRYKVRGLHFRHTDNVNHWLRAMDDIGMPSIFWPETTDIYDRKNIPRTIYCIHALSLYMFKLGKAPQIQDLYGKIKFTEEEISAMRKELEKYGIQMPAFSKIGGILANEMPVDEAALHAAVIAINEAIDRQVAHETMKVMQNSEAHLVNIHPQQQDRYQHALYDAKQGKAEIARNKSMDPDSSYVPDVYDELLTQAEIQGNINKVNTDHALMKLSEAVLKYDRPGVLAALRMPQLTLRDVKDDSIDFYLGRLRAIWDTKKNNNNEEDSQLTKDEVQMAVNAANCDADINNQRMMAVQAINHALESENPETSFKALENPRALLPSVTRYAACLYHEELRSMKDEKQSELEYDEIVGGLQVLSSVAKINNAVEAGDASTVFDAMSSQSAHLIHLDEEIKDKYMGSLSTAMAIKQKSRCSLLTHYEIQQCVDDVNGQVVDENQRILAVQKINEAVDEGEVVNTLAALQLPSAGLMDVEPLQGVQYQNLLVRWKQAKQMETDDPSAVLWYEEIQNAIDAANTQALDGGKMSVGVAAVNIAVDTADAQNLLTCLQNPDVSLHSVTPQCSDTYLARLHDYKEEKMKGGDCGTGWMMNRLKDGHRFYFNVHTLEFSWERHNDMRKDNSLLTRDEIQSCVSEVTAAYDRQLLFKANERFIIMVQARIRGHLARSKFNERLSFMRTQLPAIIKIQAWWRMILVHRWYRQRKKYFCSQESAVIRLQSEIRMFQARKKYLNRLNYFKHNENAVIKLQSFMRANWAKHDYNILMHGENPAVSTVRKFVHLLDVGDFDYNEEIELQGLRQQVVQEIRSNQQLENDLNQMDIKIGLLVKNRITLQDVISQSKTLKKYRDNSSSSLQHGIKALSKQSRERLEAYQHLFYLLQTNPCYLARLIFEMPQSRTTKFMESVILTLYNYASNQREEYLLLKLFQTALQEEIHSKVEKMSDIVTGNPLVVKMIVSFNRNTRGQGTLRELLNPLVRGVIDDRNLQINTNPIEVYKHWVNQMESQTGQASGLPYDVTPEQALQHSEVRERIQQSVTNLQNATERFLDAILRSIDKIPYAMRYMAKVMKDALHAKFPQAPEKDILKIVGNLIYYRYINSAIVAPDAFDIIDVGAHKGLTNDQRRNLGSIAKILQFAASNKGFGGDSAHLSCLNNYIMEAHNRFKIYFKAICDVDDPEIIFNMDQYTDVTKVTKPVIYISIAEIIDTHKLLLEHQDAIARDPNDPLHELLEDLGETPDAELLIGDAGLDDNGGTKNQLSKIEISLTLSNKFEAPEDDQLDVKALLIRTKKMVVDVIRCQRSGDHLADVLTIPATDNEENEHEALIRKRERIDMKASKRTKLAKQQSTLNDTRLSLEKMKDKIYTNLQQLEKLGVVSKSNNYQAVINSIVQDIRNQRIYRQRRKQNMMRLRSTLKSLGTKRAFFEEQIDYYNQYVKTCLENLSTKGKKSGRKYKTGKESRPRVKGSVKYSGAKLHEKGVILEIEDLATNQFKNVLFEISATENPGVFDVNAKFMGVSMDKVELVFQGRDMDEAISLAHLFISACHPMAANPRLCAYQFIWQNLLQLQYEGVAVMKMFGKARVNVNLLIFLLNKKFYGK